MYINYLMIADGTSKTQINKVVCHPTLPIVVSAHEDKYIRFYDSNTGKRRTLASWIFIPSGTNNINDELMYC